MKKAFLTLFLCVAQVALAHIWEPTQVESFSTFSGDRHGEFKDDILVHLADGSIWKVHPLDREKVSQWNPYDRVHAQVRKSFYWFKREHKFALLNHKRGESVRAMLIFHGTYAKQIIWATQPQPKVITRTPIYRVDKYGNRVWAGEETSYSDYRQTIQLNDGTFWEIRGQYNCFRPGTTLYVGWDNQENDNGLFFIVGTEREALWTPFYNFGTP